MRKDVVYSIRMSNIVREALKRAAQKERRTVASLLDKIILDYLEEQHYLLPSETGSDRRRHHRNKITLPATTAFFTGNHSQLYPCVIIDIASGGVLINYPKGSKINLSDMGELPRFELAFQLPQMGRMFKFECDARRIIEKDGEIQVGAVLIEPNKIELEHLNTYLA
jgi:predicted DNA-binding protein